MSIWHVTFYALWGGWNVFFYPFLGQWYSAVAGVAVLAANAVWVACLMRYRPKKQLIIKVMCEFMDI